jgi:hypothetical protein
MFPALENDARSGTPLGSKEPETAGGKVPLLQQLHNYTANRTGGADDNDSLKHRKLSPFHSQS